MTVNLRDEAERLKSKFLQDYSPYLYSIGIGKVNLFLYADRSIHKRIKLSLQNWDGIHVNIRKVDLPSNAGNMYNDK